MTKGMYFLGINEIREMNRQTKRTNKIFCYFCKKKP